MKKEYFTFRKSKKDDIGTIYVRFLLNGESIYFTTNIQCAQSEWNKKGQYIKGREKTTADKNLILNNIRARCNDVFVKYRLRDRELDRETFMKEYRQPTDFNNFYAYVDKYMNRTKNTIEFETLQTHRTIIAKLKNYAPNLTFDQLTYDFILNYFHYLRKTLGNREATAYKNLSIIKKYVRAACREGYMAINPFDEFRIKKVKGRFSYLTADELRKFIELKSKLGGNLLKVMQVFLYMCFSSQHISDARAMRIEQFKGVEFTYYRKKLRNSKPEPITIPISEPLRKIVAEIAGDRKKGMLFENLISGQKINVNLKELAKMAGVNKNITCKTARHTFATYFLEKTHQLATLKELLGHSDVKETLIYAHVVDKTKIEGMRCFDSFM